MAQKWTSIYVETIVWIKIPMTGMIIAVRSSIARHLMLPEPLNFHN
jgi:hypothetical protein